MTQTHQNDPDQTNPDRPEPMIDWPNSESIREEVLSMIANNNSSTEPNGCWLDQQQTEQLAPGITREILEEIAQYNLPDHLLQQLDDEQRYIAAQVLEALPDDQQQRLNTRFQQVQDE